MPNQPKFRIIAQQPTAPVRVSTGKKSTKWQEACRTCGGDGDVPVSADDAENEGDDDDAIAFCTDCLGQGKCPRCAKELPADWKEQLKDVDETLKCSHCRWEDGDDPVLKPA